MTSKNLFFNLMKEDLKRRLWAAALTFLAFFFSLPVASAMALSDNRYRSANVYEKMASSVRSILGLNNGFLSVFIVLLALILGVTSFSWLHSRKKVDFYHSLPVKREKLFFVNYLDGIMILAAAYAVNLFFGVVIALVNGIAPGDFLPAVMKAFGFYLLHFTMLYSVTVLAMVMTGHILVGILGTGVFHFYFPALVLILDALYQEFFKTSYNGGSSLAYRVIDKCSALTLYIGNYGVVTGASQSGSVVLRMVSVVLVIAVVTAVSLLLYRLRGSESAGKAMAFGMSRPLIRIPLVTLSALCGGLFFWELRDSLGWAAFGIACGLLLSHCIIEIIYHFDFKKLFANRISMAVCAVAAVLIFCGFRFDLFGYDKYIPKQASLESVAVSLSNMEYWVDYGDVKVDRDGVYTWEYESSDSYLFSRMSLSDTDTALALVREAVSQTQKEKSGVSFRDMEDGNHYVSFSVKFKLKSGREVYRSYSVYGDTTYELVKKIYDSPDYRKAAYPVMEQTPEETGKIKLYQSNWTREITRGRSEGGDDYVDLILRSYQEEMAALTSDVMERENPIARIQFMTVKQMAAEAEKEKEGNAWRFDNILNKGYYPVYPSFTKTISLMADCGIELSDGTSNGKVIKAEIDLWQMKKGDSECYSSESSDLTVTDSGELKALMEHARLEEYSNMNAFFMYADRIRFRVTVQGESGQTNYTYTIDREEVPEFLEKEAERFLQAAETVSD